MTPNPIVVSVDEPIVDAARKMRDADIGDVVVVDGGRVRGILTDRDIVVRAVAEGFDPAKETVDTIYTGDVATVSPETATDEAVRIMREKAIRRLPVVEDDRPAGIVSIGDLAVAADGESALADISAAPPND
jgi:CBS domain-containing protein